jgi:hypothetical protein
MREFGKEAQGGLAGYLRRLSDDLGYQDLDSMMNPRHGRGTTRLTTAEFYSIEPEPDLEDLEAEVDEEPDIYEIPTRAGATQRYKPDAPPHSASNDIGVIISFVADMLSVLGIAGMVPWGKRIYEWLRQSKAQRSANAGALLPVAVWHLHGVHPTASIDPHRYDCVNPVVDSGYAAPFEAVYLFRFYDSANKAVYIVEVDSKGELRSLTKRDIGFFE